MAIHLDFKLTEESKNLLKKYSWLTCVIEEAKDEKGNYYQRKRGSSVIYKKVREDDFVCLTCHSGIFIAPVDHPYETGGFHVEHIPYCPKCEKKPNPLGDPISE